MCMQQRFSKNEAKKYQITKIFTASDLRNHRWIASLSDDQHPNNKNEKYNSLIKKKQS